MNNSYIVQQYMRYWITTLLLLYSCFSANAKTVFEDQLVQAPGLKEPERGSLVGTFAQLNFGPSDVSRGTPGLSSPFAAPSSRGKLLASIFPAYSIESGISEWGMGWQTQLEIRRHRILGHVDYQRDEFISPWGRLQRAKDDFFYPKGISAKIKLQKVDNSWVALAGDGTTYRFDPGVETTQGTYSWLLSDVTTLVGDRTSLNYEQNESGRHFLKQVHYGGRQSQYQYEIEVEYEPIGQLLSSYVSGDRVVLDQRVAYVHVKSRHGGNGEFTRRYHYELEYKESPLGPAFYLVSITKVYASGSAEPAITYTYDYGKTYLENEETVFIKSEELSKYLDNNGILAFQPSRSTQTDIEEDGLIDLEHHLDYSLWRQTSNGWVKESLPAESGDENPVCRQNMEEYNTPRTLVRMTADSEPEVFAVVFDIMTYESTLLICHRSGVERGQTTLMDNWSLDSNTRLTDLDGDHRPDLIRSYPGGYALAKNLSKNGQYQFEEQLYYSFQPVVYPHTTWLHDMNGDSIVDLVVRSDGGKLTIWHGRGQGVFEETGAVWNLYLPHNLIISDLTQYELAFIDVNKDGLKDILLQRDRGLWLFTNRGNHFEWVDVPGIEDLGDEVTFPVVADLTGSGEEQAAVVFRGQAYTFSFTQPKTGMLVEADDGKGTRIEFRYGRSSAHPGLRKRAVVLSDMLVESSGTTPTEYQYAYESPVYHRKAKFFVGFAKTQKMSPYLREEVELHHDDDLTGILLKSSTVDERTGLKQFSENNYQQDLSYKGIRWWRLADTTTGVESLKDGKSISFKTVYGEYQREFCPTNVFQTTIHGKLETTNELAAPKKLDQDLHCMSEYTYIDGTHENSEYDFHYTSKLKHNDLGQVEKIWSIADNNSLLLQHVEYDELNRIHRISRPGQGSTEIGYHPQTGQLNFFIAPDKTETRSISEPITDATLSIENNRDEHHSLKKHYRYDGFERLWKSWDSFGNSSESVPNLELAYSWAKSNQPAKIWSYQLIDAQRDINSETISLLSASGADTTSLANMPNGWMVSGLTWTDQKEIVASSFLRKPLSAQTNIESINYETLFQKSWLVSSESLSGLGFSMHQESAVQEGITQTIEQSLLISEADKALISKVTVNGSHSTSSAKDVNDQLLWIEDQEENRTNYKYNALGRLVQITLPDGALHTVEYDEFGRKEAITRQDIGSMNFFYYPTSGLLKKRRSGRLMVS